MPPAPISALPAALLTVGFSFGLHLPLFGAEEVDVEVLEVPASEAIAAATVTDGSRPLTLSEQHARSQVGTRYLSRTSEPGIPPDQLLTLFECRELLAEEPGPVERTALVVELNSSRAYLLIGGRMLLETPVFLSAGDEELPHGWIPVTRRVLDGAPVPLDSPSPTYWLEVGAEGVGLHAGMMETEGTTRPYGSIRLPRAAMASVFRHLQPGTLVYLCPSWLDSDADLPLRVAHQGFLPKGPMSAPDEPSPPTTPDLPAPKPAPAAKTPLQPLPAPAPASRPELAGDGAIRQRTLIPVSAAAAMSPAPQPSVAPESAQAAPAPETSAPGVPPAPVSPPPLAIPTARELPVPEVPPAGASRPQRLRDLWGTKEPNATKDLSKPKAASAPAPSESAQEEANRKAARPERGDAQPPRLRDLWTSSPDSPGSTGR